MEGIPLSEAELCDWYAEHVVGTMDSGWRFLRHASTSAYSQAARALADIAKTWSSSEKKRDEAPGELLFQLELGYTIGASGPLLSAVLLPTFALESFLGVCANAALASEGVSGRGLALALDGFDRKPFAQRFTAALDLAGAEACPKPVWKDIESLIAFRNSVAHDTPVLNAPDGVQLRAKRGEVKPLPRDADDPFPNLRDSMMPLDLAHARKAAECHDSFVDHLLETADASFKEMFDRVLGLSDRGPYRIDAFGVGAWEKGAQVEAYWSEHVVPWISDVPAEALSEFLMDMRRRRQVKLAEG